MCYSGRILRCILPGLLFLSGESQGHCQKVINPEVIGSDKEISPVLRPGVKTFYDEDAKTWYAVYNDQATLYVLQPVSYALKYQWTPVTGLSDPDIKYPMAAPSADLDYLVTANNRRGQLVFTTVQNGKGWDGTLGGKSQSTGTYVYRVGGKDYNGNAIFKKGTFELLR